MRISDWSSDVCSSDLSDKGDKTVVVKVERKVKHPLYGKIIRRSKKYHAHDEDNSIKAGETVRIEETKPYSKLKTWKVLNKVETSIKPTAAPVATPASDEVEASEVRSKARRVGKECDSRCRTRLPTAH